MDQQPHIIAALLLTIACEVPEPRDGFQYDTGERIDLSGLDGELLPSVAHTGTTGTPGHVSGLETGATPATPEDATPDTTPSVATPGEVTPDETETPEAGDFACDGEIPTKCLVPYPDGSECAGKTGCNLSVCSTESHADRSLEMLHCLRSECGVTGWDLDCIEAWHDLAAACVARDCSATSPCSILMGLGWQQECRRP
jgi:hypothetical protein